MPSLRLGVFASHTGTNLQAIIDACDSGIIEAEVVLVVGNNSGAFALERARQAGIPTAHLSSKTHPDAAALDGAIFEVLHQHQVQLIALAGYNKQLGPLVVDAYRNRILNIHPAPLPRFGGPGLYGRRVHEAVLESGVAESAATIHLADEEYDHGAVVSEWRVPVLPGDTPDTLQDRVRSGEHRLYVSTLSQIADGRLDLDHISEVVQLTSDD